MPVKRAAPPPSDEQLAAAERTDRIRRADRLAAIEDQQEQERLAKAGEPESEERVALRASASVLESRPAENEEPIDVEPTPPITRPKRQARVRKIDTARTAQEQPEIEEPPAEDQRDIDEKRAYKLMDLAYKKWEKGARKNLTNANRELAFDLGKDTALYLRAGIIRLADIHATIEKLTATAKAGKDNSDGEENFDDQLAEMRAALRGE